MAIIGGRFLEEGRMSLIWKAGDPLEKKLAEIEDRFNELGLDSFDFFASGRRATFVQEIRKMDQFIALSSQAKGLKGSRKNFDFFV